METVSETKSEATTGVVELGHVVLFVSDLARSTEFYRDVLGWPVVFEPSGAPVKAFRASNTHHDLMLIEVGAGAQPVPRGRRVGVYHFGLKVGDSDDQLRAVARRLAERPDLVSVEGATDHGLTHSLYVKDPDGNEIELYVDVPGVDWDDPEVWATSRPLTL